MFVFVFVFLEIDFYVNETVILCVVVWDGPRNFLQCGPHIIF